MKKKASGRYALGKNEFLGFHPAASRYKRLKERQLSGLCLPQAFRVPLHADKEAFPRQLRAFAQPVLAVRGGDESLAHVMHPLMVQGIDPGAVSQNRLQAAVGGQGYGMGRIVLRLQLPVRNGIVGDKLLGNILINVTAQGNIHDLKATAYALHRLDGGKEQPAQG